MTPAETPLLNDRQALLTVAQVRERAIQATAPHDWDAFGNKMSPSRPAIEKMAATFAVSLTVLDIKRLDTLNDSGQLEKYIYQASVVAAFESPVTGSAVSVNDIGTMASNDPFFCTRNGGKIPAHQVDEENILKAAISNGFGRAVSTLLGLGEVTADELKALGVPVTANATQGAYQNGDDAARRESQRVEISQIVNQVALARLKAQYPDAVPEAFESIRREAGVKILVELTEYESPNGTIYPGKQSTKDIADKGVYPVLNKAKALYQNEIGKAWTGAQS